ncbi:hypothetical protein QJS04_geneDACA022530 [Acorus gramineus]|uniref:Methyltransferase type 11 domain-containing protein n=1 Tax=Acorus gramineus TaxID=55184 RepID=A0AAV9A8X6_ACOGR|nr:hypothetical protein QJS04_geneDACA022530 [Acorus gramineus]
MSRNSRDRMAKSTTLSSSPSSSSRDWSQIYTIYGTDEWPTVAFLTFHALLFSALSILIILCFPASESLLHRLLPPLPPSSLRLITGLSGSVSAIIAVCLLSAAAEILHSSVSLHWRMSQRVVSAVPDWSSVRTVLDVGPGRGMLLNSVALRLKKEGGCGRVVGLVHRRRGAALAALRTARAEGVEEYVTCREGDATRLPFADGYFDVVVSAGVLEGVGSEAAAAVGRRRGVAEAAERGRVLGEVVRVMKGGGVGVIWDLMHVQEYVQRLREMKMEDIQVSERVTAYLVSSQIVSFRKPKDPVAIDSAQLEWRTDIISC